MKVKRLYGECKVFKGTEQVCLAKYNLEIRQDVVKGQMADGMPYEIPGLATISGTVRGMSQLPFGERLNLVTEEGHTMEFSCIDTRYGTITVDGPLLDKNGNPVDLGN